MIEFWFFDQESLVHDEMAEQGEVGTLIFFSVVHVELHLDVIYRLCFCGQVQSEERQGEHTDASESDGSGYKPPMGPIASKAMPITSKARPIQRPVDAEWPAHLPKPPPPPKWWPFN